jgi:hypothetical protein
MVTTVNPLLCHSYYSTARDAADVGRGCATTVGQFDCPDCIGQGRAVLLAVARARHRHGHVTVARSLARFVSAGCTAQLAALYNPRRA